MEPDAPSADDVAGFIEYQTACHRSFNTQEHEVAEAAATWVRCYNARCQLESRVRRAMARPPDRLSNSKAGPGG